MRRPTFVVVIHHKAVSKKPLISARSWWQQFYTQANQATILLTPQFFFLAQSFPHQGLKSDSRLTHFRPCTLAQQDQLSRCPTRLTNVIRMKDPRKGSDKPVLTVGRLVEIFPCDVITKIEHAECRAGGRKYDAREKGQSAASVRGFRSIAIITTTTSIRMRDLNPDLL